MTAPVQKAGGGSSELLPILNNIYLPEWQVINASFIINDIQSFADQIINLSEDYVVMELSSWGRDLLNACQAYDILPLAALLRSFPALVEKLLDQNNH